VSIKIVFRWGMGVIGIEDYMFSQGEFGF
jgi:hypothetical protein